MKKTKLFSVLLAAALSFGTIALPNNYFDTAVTAEAAAVLEAPTDITYTAKSDSITLKWTGIDGADAYRVYKYNAKTEKFEKYKNVSGNVCNITGLKKSTMYYFKVAALVKDGSSYVEGTKTGKIKVKTKESNIPAAPSSGYTGKATADGKTYYYENGKAKTGFVKLNDSYYYFTDNGMLKSSWLNYKELYYYFTSDGKMAAGKTLKIGSYKYTFTSSGYVDWDSVTVTPKASYTVGYEELDISTWMSSEYDMDADFTLINIDNNGSKPLYVQKIGSVVDSEYESYDRLVILVDTDLNILSQQKIAAGKSDFAFFINSSSTWYDKNTKLLFFVEYDGVLYGIQASSKGETCMIMHMKYDDIFDD